MIPAVEKMMAVVLIFNFSTFCNQYNDDDLKMIDSIIKIHVYDERRRLQKDFKCLRSILTSEIQYFDSYLNSELTQKQSENVEISVQCDCFIFEWILKYMQNPQNPPQIDPFCSIHILIASEYLQIKNLIQFCSSYIGRNLKDTIFARADLSCISDSTVRTIAGIVTPAILVDLPEHFEKNHFISRVITAKINLEFCSHPMTQNLVHNERKKENIKKVFIVACCRLCGKIFINNPRVKSQCHFSFRLDKVDYRGQFASINYCEPIPNWSFEKFLGSLNSNTKMTQNEKYWHLWAAATCLYTEDGKLKCVDSSALNWKCPYSAKYSNNGSTLWGIHPCCGKLSLKYNPWANNKLGCSSTLAVFDPIQNIHERKSNNGLSHSKSLKILKKLSVTFPHYLEPIYSDLSCSYSPKPIEIDMKMEEQQKKTVGAVNFHQNHQMSSLKQPYQSVSFNVFHSISNSAYSFSPIKSSSYPTKFIERESFLSTASKIGINIRKKKTGDEKKCQCHPKDFESFCKFNQICPISSKFYYALNQFSSVTRKEREILTNISVDIGREQISQSMSYLATFRLDVDVINLNS